MIERAINIFNFYSLKLKARLKAEEFSPTMLSVIISPIYIVRNGLYKGVANFAKKFHGDILDFGCGTKPYEALFTNANSYVGVDIEVSGHCHKDSKVDFFYDGNLLPFPDDSFDCVVCFEVLEHVFNIDKVCSEISRVLKPNGLFLGTLPFVWEEHEEPYDCARYTSFGIKNIFSRNNLHVVELLKSTTYVLTVGQLLINFISKTFYPPHSRYLGLIFRFLVIFPLNLVVLSANGILPKRYSLYLSNIVLCQNIKP
jgi:SAM-dependent methyltransferase